MPTDRWVQTIDNHLIRASAIIRLRIRYLASAGGGGMSCLTAELTTGTTVELTDDERASATTVTDLTARAAALIDKFDDPSLTATIIKA